MGFFKFMADPVRSFTDWGPVINPWTKSIIGSDLQRTVTPAIAGIAGGVVGSAIPGLGTAAGAGLGTMFGTMAGEGAAEAAGRGAPGGDANIAKKSLTAGALAGLGSYAMGASGPDYGSWSNWYSNYGNSGSNLGGGASTLGGDVTSSTPYYGDYGTYGSSSSLGGTYDTEYAKSLKQKPYLDFGTGETAQNAEGTAGKPYLDYTDQFRVEGGTGPADYGGGGYNILGVDFGGSSPPPAQPTGNSQPNKKGLFGNYGTNADMGKYMLAGSVLDYAGNYLNNQQALKGQEQYRDATTWTPERTSAYMGGLNNLVQGVYASEEEKKRKSVAEMLAGSGRGGGAYGAAAEKLGRERRETAAGLLAKGLTTTSTPPNLPLGAFNYTTPEGTALSNTGGMMGKYGNMAQQLAMIQMLYGNQAGR